jgi:hypothetical protein
MMINTAAASSCRLINQNDSSQQPKQTTRRIPWFLVQVKKGW